MKPGADSLLAKGERPDLLVRLLASANGSTTAGDLRTALLGDTNALEATFAAAIRRQLVPAAIAALEARGILHVPRHENEAPPGLLAQLAQAKRLHAERRQLLRNTLFEAVGALNRQGIEPLLLKGAVSLVSGEPAWRTLRDIDFVIPPGQAAACLAALKQQGFCEVADSGARPHHLHPLSRDGFPATLEPHVMLGGTRARSVLSDESLLRTASTHELEGVRYKLLSPAAFALHGLGHHYFQNRGYLFGTMSLKGLLEFCAGVQALTAADAAEFHELYTGNAHLSAGIATVCALGLELLALRLPEGCAISERAKSAGSEMARRILTGQTQQPFAAVISHMSVTSEVPDVRAGRLYSFQRGLRDVLHPAVWIDHHEQRRNASGILQDL